MDWVLLLGVAIAAGIVIRIYMNVHKARRQRLDTEDWDSRLVAKLRAQGANPFEPHQVDFFFALPDDLATGAVNAELEREGFTVDVKAVPENPEFPFSLHAAKSMRLSGPDMSDLSRRLRLLAHEHRGRYDGWTSR